MSIKRVELLTSKPMAVCPLRRQAFTLIELLVVVAIFAILASLLLPALSRAKYTAKIALCMNNQRQTYLGISHYTSDYDDFYPSDANLRLDMKKFQNEWDKIYVYDIKSMLVDYFGEFYVRPSKQHSYFVPEAGVFTCPLAPTNRAWTRTQYSMFFACKGQFNSGGMKTWRIGSGDKDGMMLKVGDTWQWQRTGQVFSLLISDFVNTASTYRMTNHHEFAANLTTSQGHWQSQYVLPKSSGVFTGSDGSSQKHAIPAGNSSTNFLNHSKVMVGPGSNYNFGSNQVIPLDFEE